MTGGEDPDNRHDFPGGFPGDSRSAFTSAGRTDREQEVFAWTKGLLALRAAHAETTTGMEQDLYADEASFAFVRSEGPEGCSPDHTSERILVVVNKGEQNAHLDLPMDRSTLAGCRDFQPLAPTSGASPAIQTGQLKIEVPAQSMTVFAVR
jgi:glycosidase